jgi:hypothetical protein
MVTGDAPATHPRRYTHPEYIRDSAGTHSEGGQDLFGTYLREIAQVQILDADDERRLARQLEESACLTQLETRVSGERSCRVDASDVLARAYAD